MDRQSNIASKLYQLRKERGLQQNQLAKIIGVEPPMYSKIEKGNRGIKLEQLTALAVAFKVEPKELHVLWFADKVQSAINMIPSDLSKAVFNLIDIVKNETNY